jgi:hypothetical protein
MKWFNRVKRRCPDGTSHWIYKNIDDAFPLFVSDHDSSINSNINIDGLANGELGTKHSSKIKGLLFEMDSANRNIMIEFRGVYSVYQAEPCGNAKFFSTKVSEIIEDHKNLRQLKTKIEGLVSILSASATSENGFLNAYVEIINDYGKYIPNQAIHARMVQMKNEVHDWQQQKEKDPTSVKQHERRER